MNNALDSVLHRKVRVVAASDTPASRALFDKAAGKRKTWILEDWQKVLAALDACEDTVEQWLGNLWLG